MGGKRYKKKTREGREKEEKKRCSEIAGVGLRCGSGKGEGILDD